MKRLGASAPSLYFELAFFRFLLESNPNFLNHKADNVLAFVKC